MKLQDKIDFFHNKYFSSWLAKRQEVEHRISDSNTMFCFCGRLATGFHESSCGKFRKAVDAQTVKELEHLIAAERL